MNNTIEPLDVLAVGAHPDDVEIGCGGTLASLVEQGYRVGILDLTDGEPTPNSPGPEVRLAEAKSAAVALGVQVRITLELPNRRLFDSFEARVLVAKELRKYRPRIVLALGERTPLASPDHWQAMQLTEAAVFYSRLTKWDEAFDHLPVHTIAALYYYTLAFRNLEPGMPGSPFIVDISSTLEKKIAAIRCYATQFPPSKEHLFERVRAVNMQQGQAAGFTAGELFSTPHAIGIRDLVTFSFGEPVRPKPPMEVG